MDREVSKLAAVEEAPKVYVESFGCSSNMADGERIAGCLQAAGYTLVPQPSEAGIVIYNTCAVKAPTENKTLTLLQKVPPGKKLVVAGCLPLINFPRLKKEVRFDGAIGPAPGTEIVDLVRKVEMGEKPVLLEKGWKPPLSLPKISTSPVRTIIPVAYGCLNACSFCCVRFARGRLRSYPIEDVVEYVKKEVKLGRREFWFTGQDLSCYGRDLGVDLPTLLEAVTKVEGRFFIRVGMVNPRGFSNSFLEGLLKAYESPKVFKFLHIPLQSGDDEVLKLMNRGYTVEEFRDIVSQFRRKFPQLTLATDIICGHPGESEEAHRRTIRLLEEIRPDIVNVSKFFPRPGTPAQEMNPLPSWKVKERTRKLAQICRNIAWDKNRKWLGWKGEILVEEKGRGDSWIGRNIAYKPVAVKSTENLLGRFLEVRVVETFSTHLEAVLLQ